MTQIPDEVVQRMCALVRDIDAVVEMTVPKWFPSIWSTAHDIAALLPEPVDPDGQLAREIVAELYPDAAPENENALVTCAFHGIKCGRERAERAKGGAL